VCEERAMQLLEQKRLGLLNDAMRIDECAFLIDPYSYQKQVKTIRRAIEALETGELELAQN
jgi:hypothetical protein